MNLPVELKVIHKNQPVENDGIDVETDWKIIEEFLSKINVIIEQYELTQALGGKMLSLLQFSDILLDGCVLPVFAN